MHWHVIANDFTKLLGVLQRTGSCEHTCGSGKPLVGQTVRVPHHKEGHTDAAKAILCDEIHGEQHEPLVAPLTARVILVQDHVSRDAHALGCKDPGTLSQSLAQDCVLTVGVFALVLVKDKMTSCFSNLPGCHVRAHTTLNPKPLTLHRKT